EPGAVVCRVAPSFVRFGNFEILAAHDELPVLKRLADYVISTHFPELGAPSPAVYGHWFDEICRRTAVMVSEWMRVGFVHGVMNTDNMSILGLTIDYGPYGWLEGYELGWTPNTTDGEGKRYCYGNQPNIAQWNLVRLANALLPLVQDTAALEQGLATFADTFVAASDRMLNAKLGISALDRDGDEALLTDMFALLQQAETDMTLFFRNLARLPVADAQDEARLAPLLDAFYVPEVLAADAPHRERLLAWLRRYAARVRADSLAPDERVARMNAANPKYVLRNYLAQTAIDALAEGDATVLERLMKVLQRPYDEQPEHHDLAARRPEWARHKAGCSALSCSS
ncbi:MAG: protein adenylyltransferase SelO family protein, partial [Proteobacteria bacterium]|nr:protein adenylyltransferase SelO family protein [Pseudomonadota bacterium]